MLCCSPAQNAHLPVCKLRFFAEMRRAWLAVMSFLRVYSRANEVSRDSMEDPKEEQEGFKSQVARAITRFVKEENSALDDSLLYCKPSVTQDILLTDSQLMAWAWSQTTPPDHRGARAFRRECKLLQELAKRDEAHFVMAFEQLLQAQPPLNIQRTSFKKWGDGWSSLMRCYVVVKDIESTAGLALIQNYRDLLEHIRSV